MTKKLEQEKINKKESFRLKKYYYFLLFLFFLSLFTVDDIYELENDVYPADQNHLVIELPDGIDRDAKSLFIAQRLSPDISVSSGDLGLEGGGGVLAQVVYDVSQELLVDRYNREFDLEGGSYHLAILSYFMLDDYGAQTADIIIGDRYAIRLKDLVFDTLDFITPTINVTDSHDYDIETITFLLNEHEKGTITIKNVLIKHHGVLTVYQSDVLMMSGDPFRLNFVMSRGKHAIYPSVALCRNESVRLGDILSFSTDVCDPDETISFQINEADMVGEPGQTRNPMENNLNFILFPIGSDARKRFGRAYSSFLD